MALSQEKLKKLKIAMARKQRTFTGQDLGSLIIGYLERKDRPPDDPVEHLVELSQPSLLTPHVIADFFNETPRHKPELALETRRLAYVTEEGTVAVKEQAVNVGGPVSPVIARQKLAWNQCAVLLSRGLLDRVRRCAKEDCRKLFYARFRHAVFHDEECRLAVESANPEYKERRREHMRKIREQARKGAKKS
jgi:hypothetical protein